MPVPDAVRERLAAAHTEALRVGDSPLRADRLADSLATLAHDVERSDADDDSRARILAALTDAERVLRRDDDGREAARHLQFAIRVGDVKPRAPSPFLDD